MAITDEQYADWLAKDGVLRCVLADITYYDIDAEMEGALRVSTLPFITGSGDTPPMADYEEIIDRLPTITSRLPEALHGHADISIGSLELKNQNGELDQYLDAERYIFGGRDVSLRIGDPTWNIADFRAIFTGTAEDVDAPEEGVLSVNLRSNMWYLNKTIPLADMLIGGDGPSANRPVPLVVGLARNIPAIIRDENALEYQLCRGPINRITQVRDRGVSLISSLKSVASYDAATNTITSVLDHGLVEDTVIRWSNSFGSGTDVATMGLEVWVTNRKVYYVIAAGLAAKDFRISATPGGPAVDLIGPGGALSNAQFVSVGYHEDLDNGRITLVQQPAGVITADVNGVVEGSPTEWINQIGEAISYLARNYTDLPDYAIDHSYLVNFVFAPPFGFNFDNVGVYLVGDENLMEVFAAIVGTAVAWFDFDRLGVLRFGTVVPPEGLPSVAPPTSVIDLTEDDINEDDQLTITRREQPVAVVDVGAYRNWNPQPGDLADGALVRPHTRERLSGDFVRAQYNIGTGDDHPGAGTVFIDTMGANQTPTNIATAADIGGENHVDLEAVAEIILHQRDRVRTVYDADFRQVGLLLDLGEAVTLEYPRFGFDDGETAIVVGIVDNLDDGSVTLELWR